MTIIEYLRWGLVEPRAHNEQVNLWMSRTLIFSVALIALIAMPLFPRRVVVDHLIFAVHLQAFTLIALSFLVFLSTMTGTGQFATFIAFVLINQTYAFLAIKRAYTNSWLVTSLKYVGFLVLYTIMLITIAITVLIAAGWSMSQIA